MLCGKGFDYDGTWESGGLDGRGSGGGNHDIFRVDADGLGRVVLACKAGGVSENAAGIPGGLAAAGPALFLWDGPPGAAGGSGGAGGGTGLAPCSVSAGCAGRFVHRISGSGGQAGGPGVFKTETQYTLGLRGGQRGDGDGVLPDVPGTAGEHWENAALGAGNRGPSPCGVWDKSNLEKTWIQR